MIVINTNFLYAIAFVIGIVLIECGAQYCLKKYEKCKLFYWFIFGVLIYGIIAYILVLSFKYEKLAIVNVMWGGLSALILTLMAYYFYGEKLSWKQILGIIVIIAGTLILNTS